MQILQNVEMLELTFNPDDNEIRFVVDKLPNKKILSIYVSGVPYLGPIHFPPKPNPNLSPTEIKSIGLYLNLFDQCGKQIVTELSTNNICFDNDYQSFIQWDINQFVDFDKSYLFYRSKAGITRKAKIRLFISYQTQNFKQFNDEISGSKTIFFDNADKSSFLDKFIDHTLRDKEIKRIDTNFRGGLFIKGKDDRVLDLVAKSFFVRNTHKHFYLDPVEIDFEKSQIKDETPFPVSNFTRSITFYY